MLQLVHCCSVLMFGCELHKYMFNTDDINQVVLNRKGTFLAAADDSGEIKVIDVLSHKLKRTLRGGHTNICSAVQFHTQRPWEAVSGGLDSKVIKWDFFKGKILKVHNLALSSQPNLDNMCNPPFVHSLATPEGDPCGEIGKLLAVGRGDGAVDVFDISFQKDQFSKQRHGNIEAGVSPGASTDNMARDEARLDGQRCHLDAALGGHSSAVSSVAFTRFGQSGRYILSGGNDKHIKVWDWSILPQSGNLCTGSHPLMLDINHKKKINWLSTCDRSSGNLVVADTSKILGVYQVM